MSSITEYLEGSEFIPFPGLRNPPPDGTSSPYRLYFALYAVLAVLLGGAYGWLGVSAVDPFWLRYGVAALAAVAALGAPFSRTLERHLGRVWRSFLVLFVGWFLARMLLNGATFPYLVGLLFVVAVATGGFLVGLRRLAPLGAFLGSTVAVSVAALVVELGPGTSTLLWVGFLLVLGGVLLVVSVDRLWTIEILEEKEQRYRRLFESSRDAIVLTDAEGEVEEANPAARQIFGYDQTGVDVGTLFAEFEERLDLRRALGRYGSVRDFEISLPTPDGATVAVSVTTTIRRDDEGEVVGYKHVLQDVTEKKVREERLRLLNTAVEAARDAVVIARVDPEREGDPLRIRYVNRAFERITGYEPARARERGLDLLVGPQTDRSALKRFYQAARGHRPAKEELVVQRKDGSSCWVEMTVAPVEEAVDPVRHVVMIQREVTERKKRERFERAERDLLELVAEGGSVEDGLKRLIGLLEGEDDARRGAILLMENRSGRLRHLSAPRLPEAFQTAIEQVGEGPTVASCGAAYYRNEPVIVTDVEEDSLWANHVQIAREHDIAACWSNPIRSSDGHVMGVVCVYHPECREPEPEDWKILRKVTHLASIVIEWKRAEVALEESEHLFRTLAEESLLGIYLVQDGHFEYVNPRFCEISGYSYDELIDARGLEEVIHPDDYQALEEDLRRRQDGEESGDLHHRFRLVTKDEEIRHVEVFGSPVSYLGKTAIFGTLLDVTERKEQEEELIAAKEEAEEMHRLKSAFLANMSHEIRTPLTSILGFSEILADEVPEEGEEFVGLIRQSGERLYETLNSVLDLSELEAGAMTASNGAIDVSDRVETTVDMLLPQALQKDIQLKARTPEDEVEAYLDGASIDRIVTNLVHNAIKFTEEGSVTVGVEETEWEVVLSVEDTGVGMSEEFLPNLFEAFHQESTGLTRSYKGAGLGLTITQRLVDLLDGEIDVTSEKGEGTTFTVRLPRKKRSG